MTDREAIAPKTASNRALCAALIVLACMLGFLLALGTASPVQALTLQEGTIFKSSNVTYKVTELDSYGRGGEAMLVRYDSYRTTPIVNTVYYRGHRLRGTPVESNSFNTIRGHKITRVTLNENVESIGMKSFYKCAKLRNINLQKCSAISVSYNRGTWEVDNADIGWNAFRDVNRNVTVQCGSTSMGFKSVYKAELESKGMPGTAKMRY